MARNLIFFVKLHKIMKKRKIFREIDPKIMKKNPKILCSVLPTVSQNIGKKFQILVRLRETREIKWDQFHEIFFHGKYCILLQYFYIFSLLCWQTYIITVMRIAIY